MTSEFDAENGKWNVKIVGTGFGSTDDDKADLQIGGVSQKFVSHADTMAVFEITDVKDLVSTDVNLFFPIGIPKGHDLVRAGITLEPKFMSMTPNAGTPGGTLIQAQVPGVGTSTTGLDFYNKATGQSICIDNIRIVEYGVIECWSKRENYGDEAFDV